VGESEKKSLSITSRCRGLSWNSRTSGQGLKEAATAEESKKGGGGPLQANIVVREAPVCSKIPRGAQTLRERKKNLILSSLGAMVSIRERKKVEVDRPKGVLGDALAAPSDIST